MPAHAHMHTHTHSHTHTYTYTLYCVFVFIHESFVLKILHSQKFHLGFVRNDFFSFTNF